jgi:tRNA splicing endonuclease
MSDEDKFTPNVVLKGLFFKNDVWVRFTDESRRFFEKSYYGNLFNKDFRQIASSLEDIPTIPNESTKESIEPSKRPEYISFHPLEALYLIERQKLLVHKFPKKNETLSSNLFQDLDQKDNKDNKENKENKDLYSFNDILEISMDTDSRVWQRYIVYRDMRHRGYIIRVGYGGSADFRVFDRGAKHSKDSAKFVYFIIQDGIPVALNELESIVNQVLGDRKELILAIFDKLGDSTFYELEKFKFSKVSSFDEVWNKETKIMVPKKKTNENSN